MATGATVAKEASIIIAGEPRQLLKGQSIQYRTGPGPRMRATLGEFDVRGFQGPSGRVRWKDVTELEVVAAIPIGNGSSALAAELSAASAHSGGIAKPGETISSVPLDDIEPSKLNPRKRFDEAALKELAESIDQHGLIQPIVLRSTPGARCRYTIIAGERRYRAHRLLGKTEISAVVRRGLEDTDHVELALVENLLRSDISPIEEAEGYQKLIDEGKSQSYIARRVGRSQPHIANTVKLLKLPAEVQEAVRTGAVSGTAGENLARFAEFPAVTAVYLKLLQEKRVKASELEKGTPFTPALVNAGAAVELRDWQFPFVKTICQKQCPFNAYRKSDYTMLCLRPEHFEVLRVEEAERQRQEVQSKARAAGVESAEKLPILGQTLNYGYGQYETLNGKRPKGCSSKCECQGLAIDRHSGKTVQICTNPRRYRKLVNAEAAEEKMRKKAEYLPRLRPTLQTFRLGQRLHAAAAIVIQDLVLQADKTTLAGAAAAVGISFEVPKGASGYGGDRALLLNELALHSAETQLALAAEIVLQREIDSAVQWSGGKTPNLDWLVPRPVEPEPVPDSMPCEKCGGECTVENAGVVVGVEHDEIGERGIVWCVNCRDEARAAAPAEVPESEAVAA